MKAVWLIVAAALVISCGKSAEHVKAAGKPTLPSGWSVADDAQDGITLGVAPGWREGADTGLDPMEMAQGVAGDASQPSMDPDSPAGKLQADIQKQNAADEKEALANLRAKGVVIQIIDSSKPIPGEARTRYYVKKVDHGGNYALDAAKNDEIDFLGGSAESSAKKVELPIGPAYRFEIESKTRGGDELARISFVVVDGSNSYSLRFIATNNSQAIQSIADSVAHTWRITPGKS
ncbi:MAG TPA: hypothetical protein VG944_02380 [Fimbriimonas sp.]|nr:hypothetical protein [Fimbriimonas sp.]